MRPEPTLTDLTADAIEAFDHAIERGFNESPPPEVAEFTRRYIDPARFFGFRTGERWVATFGSFERTMTVPGGAAVPVAAITCVTVHPPFRRRGLLGAMMQQELQRCRARDEPVAVLWASEGSIYGRFGFAPATRAVRMNADTRELTFLPGVAITGWCDEVGLDEFLAAAGPLYDLHQRERPGLLDRPRRWWDWLLHDPSGQRNGATELRLVLHHGTDDRPDGWAAYRVKPDGTPTGPAGTVQVGEVHGRTPAAHAALWRYVLDQDLTRRVTVHNIAADETLPLLLRNARALETIRRDNLYVRIVDVAAALSARTYATDVEVVLGVQDEQLPHNTGRYRLRITSGAVSVGRTDDPADVSLSALELGAVYLGGPTLADLHRAGRVVEHTPGALLEASRAFRGDISPWCGDDF